MSIHESTRDCVIMIMYIVNVIFAYRMDRMSHYDTLYGIGYHVLTYILEWDTNLDRVS